MKFESPIRELVLARKSVRTFTGDAMGPGALEKLQAACREQERGVFNEPARFTVVEKPFSRDQPVKLSDYGLWKNPRYFIIGAIQKGERHRESWGYLLEQLVLKSQELGLGTCWMGYFNRGYFPDFQTARDEDIPSIVTVGVPAAKPRLGERFIRMGIGADNRKGRKELFFLGGFERPLENAEAGAYAEALEMVRRAPSSGNTQAWRIVKEKDANNFHFYLKKAKQSYYDMGIHHVDIGIAMCHFELAARASGLGGKWAAADPGLASVPAGAEYRVSWTGN